MRGLKYSFSSGAVHILRLPPKLSLTPPTKLGGVFIPISVTPASSLHRSVQCVMILLRGLGDLVFQMPGLMIAAELAQ
jgi:hypothetical protein